MSDPTLLESINSPADLRRLDRALLPQLAAEVRQCVLRTVAKTGGHLSASLGAVEIAVALHYVFDTPEDRIVWDVGHQSYAHKILTGRRERMAGLRQLDGISGFPKRGESEYDTFGTGHSSTSISPVAGHHGIPLAGGVGVRRVRRRPRQHVDFGGARHGAGRAAAGQRAALHRRHR